MNLPKQQTPKPAAQLPPEVPLLDVHSVEVRQVPISPEVAVQASFGNLTTEKRALLSLGLAGTPMADATRPGDRFININSYLGTGRLSAPCC